MNTQRKTLIIFIGVIVLCLLILTGSSLLLQKNESAKVATPRPKPTKTEDRVKTVLLAVPSKTDLLVGEEFTVAIMVQTNENLVTGAQLEMQYDPTVIKVTKISSGGFFAQPLEYANKNNATTGEIVYAIGSFDGKKGDGILATLQAEALKKTIGAVEVLTIKPTTLISELNTKQSVLKTAKGAKIVIR